MDGRMNQQGRFQMQAVHKQGRSRVVNSERGRVVEKVIVGRN